MRYYKAGNHNFVTYWRTADHETFEHSVSEVGKPNTPWELSTIRGPEAWGRMCREAGHFGQPVHDVPAKELPLLT